MYQYGSNKSIFYIGKKLNADLKEPYRCFAIESRYVAAKTLMLYDV